MKGEIQNIKFKIVSRQKGVIHDWRSLAFWLLAFAFSLSAKAQPKDISSSEILHRIEGLKTTATVLYIAAHPDDENTRLISYLTKGKHYRVAYLSLTRGEGGQNLIGDEQGVDLGILRTQELLAARKIDGGEQFFSTAYDFGYSKTPEETMKKWGRKKIVGDIITVMNHLQPDIVICRFPTTGEGGHGHHTASAMLAEEAFDSLVKANGTYVPKKLFWNTFNFGTRNTTSEDQLKIDVGGYNALLGKSYGEIAAEARSMHRCQAFGSERRRGEQFEYFKTLRDNTPKLGNTGAKEQGLMEGIDTDWSRFKGGEAIDKKIDAIVKEYKINDPSSSVKELLILRGQIEKLAKENINAKIISKRLSELDELILDCAGIYLEFTNDRPEFSIQDSLVIKMQLINRSNLKCSIEKVENDLIRNPFDSLLSLPLNAEKNKLISKSFVWKKIYGYYHNSFPYPSYVIETGDDTSIVYNRMVKLSKEIFYSPEHRDYSKINAAIRIEGEIIQYKTSIFYKRIDPSYGERFQPIFDNGTDVFRFQRKRKEIKYDHIPTQIYYTKPDPILKFDYVKTVQKKIAYISGAGDKIPEILSQIGYDVTLLDEKSISSFELKSFDAIVTGVRAFNTEKWLTDYNSKFLKYVEEGGNLLIQYNTSNALVAEIPKPYPFKISRNRITEEESEAIILDTNAKIMNYPNKIGNEDFKNWIQEYGLYFPSDVDTNYKKIISLHDTGENPNENSTIYCPFGKGKYVYTGLSFFRELPAGVPGAIKLFINLMEDNEEMKKGEMKNEIETLKQVQSDSSHEKQKTKNK